MEGDDGVHRSICCRQLLSADRQPEVEREGGDRCQTLTLPLPVAFRHACDNLTFYLLEWIYFGIKKLENSATTRLCFM